MTQHEISLQADPIAALDLEPIKVKLMHVESGEGWSRAQADAVEKQYRRFLHLMKKYPDEQAAPLMDVDTFWHYHILDTLKYAADCQAVFGYFLHHFPYIGLRGEADEEAHHQLGARMKELYEETFGEDYLQGASAWSAAQGAVSADGRSAWSAATVQSAWSAAAVPQQTVAWSAAAKPQQAVAWSAAAKPQQAVAWSAAAKPQQAVAWSAAAEPQQAVAWSASPASARRHSTPVQDLFVERPRLTPVA